MLSTERSGYFWVQIISPCLSVCINRGFTQISQCTGNQYLSHQRRLRPVFADAKTRLAYRSMDCLQARRKQLQIGGGGGGGGTLQIGGGAHINFLNFFFFGGGGIFVQIIGGRAPRAPLFLRPWPKMKASIYVCQYGRIKDA